MFSIRSVRVFSTNIITKKCNNCIHFKEIAGHNICQNPKISGYVHNEGTKLASDARNGGCGKDALFHEPINIELLRFKMNAGLLVGSVELLKMMTHHNNIFDYLFVLITGMYVVGCHQIIKDATF